MLALYLNEPDMTNSTLRSLVVFKTRRICVYFLVAKLNDQFQEGVEKEMLKQGKTRTCRETCVFLFCVWGGLSCVHIYTYIYIYTYRGMCLHYNVYTYIFMHISIYVCRFYMQTIHPPLDNKSTTPNPNPKHVFV